MYILGDNDSVTLNSSHQSQIMEICHWCFPDRAPTEMQFRSPSTVKLRYCSAYGENSLFVMSYAKDRCASSTVRSNSTSALKSITKCIETTYACHTSLHLASHTLCPAYSNAVHLHNTPFSVLPKCSGNMHCSLKDLGGIHRHCKVFPAQEHPVQVLLHQQWW